MSESTPAPESRKQSLGYMRPETMTQHPEDLPRRLETTDSDEIFMVSSDGRSKAFNIKDLRDQAGPLLRQNLDDAIEKLRERHGLTEGQMQELRDLPAAAFAKNFAKSMAPAGPNLDTQVHRPVTQSGEPDTWSGQPLNP